MTLKKNQIQVHILLSLSVHNKLDLSHIDPLCYHGPDKQKQIHIVYSFMLFPDNKLHILLIDISIIFAAFGISYSFKKKKEIIYYHYQIMFLNICPVSSFYNSFYRL